MYISATGMYAQQRQVDSIANNVVNANTQGYKKTRLSFTDMVSGIAENSTLSRKSEIGNDPSIYYHTGAGVALARVTKSFELGEIRKTESPLDIAISGDGFIEVAMLDGARGYFRGGSLSVNKDGQLSTATGIPLKSNILIPRDAKAVSISTDGRISVQLTGQANFIDLGKLELVKFNNPSALESSGDGIYKSTEDSGEAIEGNTGEDGVGMILQGNLESSNVRMVDEMVGLMLAQRSYEASAKVLQASDELLGMINGLRK
ncbi:flagellar hook-basal body protein [Acidovorax facilis]|uniref:flagellar hook-basal body protein n=1 Tax=Acidovorax facilis TaxID=12917 RepID=UPI003CF4F9F7